MYNYQGVFFRSNFEAEGNFKRDTPPYRVFCLFVIAFLLFSASVVFAQGVGVNSSGNPPTNSAMLDVSATDKGMLIPRLTTTQRDAIVNPDQALQIYNLTTNCFEVWANGLWQTVWCAACPTPSAVTASATPTSLCEGSTLTLTSGATYATNWSWTGPNGFNSTLQNPTISGITAAGAGVYTLTASNICGAAVPVNTASVAVNTVPSAPVAGTHTPSQTQIVWNWNTVSGATGYKYNTANDYGTAIDNSANTSYTQTGLTCNTAYSLYVWAYNSCGNSSATTLMQTTASCCANGDLNTSFGIGGVIIEDPSTDEDKINAIALDATGIYTAGYDRGSVNGNNEWRIEKRDLSTGAIIWAQTEDPSTGHDIINAIAVDVTGVYVAGYDKIPGNYEGRIEKRDLSTGAIIWTQTVNPSADDDMFQAIAVDETGVYVGGFDRTSGNNGWRIEKRDLSTGAVIWIQTENPSSNNDQINAIALDATGIYVAGIDNVPNNDEWRIEKRDLSTGAIIWTQTENPSGNNEILAIALDASGVYVAGYDAAPGNAEWRIEKRNLSAGGVIWTQIENPSTTDFDEIRAIALDATGVYVAGRDYAPGNYQWRIEKRDLSTGAVTWTQTENPSTNIDYVNAIAIDATGVYAAGFDRASFNTEAQWRIEKRCK